MTNQIQIIKAEVQDWEVVKQLRLDHLKEDCENRSQFFGDPMIKIENCYSSYLQKTEQERMSLLQERTFFLAKEDDESIALIAYRNTPSGRELENLFVKEDHRKRGIARLLCIHALDDFFFTYPGKRLSLLVSAENEKAKKLYESLGFSTECFLPGERRTPSFKETGMGTRTPLRKMTLTLPR